MKKSTCKLSDLAHIITPQRDVNLIAKKVTTGEVVYNGLAHYLTGQESFCSKTVKSLAIMHSPDFVCYVVELSK